MEKKPRETDRKLPSHTQEGQPLLSKKKSSVGATVKWQKVIGGYLGNRVVFFLFLLVVFLSFLAFDETTCVIAVCMFKLKEFGG